MRFIPTRMKEYELWVNNPGGWVFIDSYETADEAGQAAPMEMGKTYQVRMFSGRVLSQFGTHSSTIAVW